MNYNFEFNCYQKDFQQPLSTSHGLWEVREGLIVKLIDEFGKIGCGEIAPIPWFGSETLDRAREFCSQLGDRITDATICNVPDRLPACQFAFQSALENLRNPQNIQVSTSQLAGLLPTGISALSTWEKLWNLGHRTFKWKIGVSDIKDEINIFKQLIKLIPIEAKLRLDANGGLSYQEARNWLEIIEETQVEFLEQPLPVPEFKAMQELSVKYSSAIALDESVATVAQLKQCYDRGWRGIFVVKPAIAGYPSQLRRFCQKSQIDAVFSSVFETSVGRQAALKLAMELSNPQRALGFGVDRWLEA